MLCLVSGIGATCCYQFECTTRRAFVESLELEELTRELKALAELDGLTGLNNRRTYDAYIDRLWRQSRREQTVLTIMLVDIDYFKAYNDRYGHQSGDMALKAVADAIAAHAKRPLDFAARYGGEEFVLALHGSYVDHMSSADNEFARMYAEVLRETILAMQISHDDSTVGEYLTVSIGVAVILPGAQRSLAGAVQMADEALYQAKEEGRNRVVVATTGNSQFRTGRFRASRPAVA
jgi:diguanylate cyclase (GGDEF)-like protein